MKSIKSNLKHNLKQTKILIDNEQVFKNMLNGFILFETNGKIIKVNPAYCKMIGYSEAKLLKMNMHDLDVSISPERTKNQIDNIIQKKTARFETKHRHKDGHLIDLDVSIIIKRNNKYPLVAAFVNDITQDKQAKETIKRFDRLIEKSLNEIYIFDANTYNFIEVNQAALNNIGYTLEELKIMTPLDIKPEFNRNSFNELVKPLRTNKTDKIVFETYHKRKNGTLYPVEVHLQLIDFKGLNAFGAIILDLSERQEAEKAKLQIEREFKNLFMSITDGIYLSEILYDCNGKPCDYKYLEVNPKFEQILGLNRDQIINKRYKELVPVDTTKWLDVYFKVARTGKAMAYEFYSPEYKMYFETYSFQPTKGKICVIVRDITESKRIETTAKRFSNLVEKSLNEIYIFDAITYKFIEANQAAINNIGYTLEELKTLTPLDIKPAYDLDSFNELIKPLKDSKKEKIEFKTYHKRKNGTIYPVEIHLQLIEFENNNVFAATILDITKRQKTEKELLKSYENYRELINGLNETVWVIGFDGKFIDVNRAAVEKMGYSREELLSMGPTDIDSNLEKNMIEDLIKNIQEDKIQVFETTHTAKDGKKISVEIQSTIVTYQNKDAILSIARDISDRKLIEKKLVEERQLFDIFMDNTVDNIYFKDKNSNFIKVNKHMAQYLNLESPEHLIGKSDFDFFDEKHANAALEDEKKILKTGVPILDKTEKEIFKDGTTGWVSTSKLPIRDLHGHIIGTFGISRDITGRINSEEEIRRLSEIVEQTESPVFLTNLDCIIEYVNPAFEKVTGFTKKNAIGQNPRILKSDLMPGDYYKRLWQTILSGEKFSEIVINKRKNGEIWYYDQTIIPLKDDKNSITQFVSTGKDITDKVLAEKALRESENRLSLAIKAAKLGIWEWDIKNKKLIWDKTMFSLYGISDKKFDGSYDYWLQRIHPDDLDKANAEFDAALKSNTDLATEFRILWPNGTIRHIQGLGILRRTEDGLPDRLIGVNWDITKQKEAEDSSRKFSEELEIRVQERTADLEKARIAALSLMQDADIQRQRAESALQELAESQESLKLAKDTAEAATKAKSNFLASMSHELRTPLNSIIGFSQVLREQYFGKLNEKQTEYVVDIMESGEHLLDLINDILDLSKIEAGKMELELDTIPILHLLENSLSMIKEKCTKKGIQLSLMTEPKFKNLKITIDQRKIKQVLFNLLSNAAKFTSAGGAITVNCLLVNEMVMIKVIDSGIGIHKDMLEKIFEEFFQVSSKIVDKTPGTGLGLSLSRRMIKMHGGQLWAESAGEGKGSTFIFEIPIEQ